MELPSEVVFYRREGSRKYLDRFGSDGSSDILENAAIPEGPKHIIRHCLKFINERSRLRDPFMVSGWLSG